MVTLKTEGAAKRDGYESATVFRANIKANQAEPTPATIGAMSRVAYDVVVEYVGRSRMRT